MLFACERSLVAGSCSENTATFGGVPFGDDSTYNTYLAKYDATGAAQWVKFVEDITCPFPQVRVGAPDEIYFSGELFGNFAFGSFTAEGPNFGDDFFLARLDASGTFQWIREVPGQGHVSPGQRTFLDADAAGNVYFTGRMRNTITWSPGQVTEGQPQTGVHGRVVGGVLALDRWVIAGDLHAVRGVNAGKIRAEDRAVFPGIRRERLAVDSNLQVSGLPLKRDR